jgi:hypothetical protein
VLETVLCFIKCLAAGCNPAGTRNIIMSIVAMTSTHIPKKTGNGRKAVTVKLITHVLGLRMRGSFPLPSLLVLCRGSFIMGRMF